MNREETKQVLKVLSTAYPRYFADMTKADKIDQINLYMDMFGEYPTQIVIAALHSYIRHNEYPPSIAGLQKQIDLLTHKDDKMELWNTLAAACSRGTRMTAEEFETLPESIREWAGDVGQIKELALMDSVTFNSVIRGQFLKTIPQIIERQEAKKKLPAETRKILEMLKLEG